MFAVPKEAPYSKKFASNIAAGGMAGAASQVFVYSLDFARTRLANDKAAANKVHYNIHSFYCIINCYTLGWYSSIQWFD